MTSKKKRAISRTFNTISLGLSCLMVSTSTVLAADTFSIDGTALNTNNQFPKLDGTPIMSTWSHNINDPDQQFDIQSIVNSNNKMLRHGLVIQEIQTRTLLSTV
jgi:hypothetical protein